MKVLELFAGSRSIGKVANKLNWEVFSSDFEAFDGIDYQIDILEFDVNKVPFKPDIIWASPPCTGFSVAAIGRNWQKTETDAIPKTDTARLGIELVRQTIQIIDHFQPKYFFIENPRGMLRTLQIMQRFKRQGVTYCQYGDDRMKPTDIWTNSNTWNPRPMCKNGDSCHISAPRGSRTGTQGLANAYERSKIPEQLCLEILQSCI
jgi:C-5 cytosine-specific DNA methylase